MENDAQSHPSHTSLSIKKNYHCYIYGFMIDLFLGKITSVFAASLLIRTFAY